MGLARKKACTISQADTTTIGVGWPTGTRELVVQAYNYWLDDALGWDGYVITEAKAAAGVSGRLGFRVSVSQLTDALATERRMVDRAKRIHIPLPGQHQPRIDRNVDLERICVW